MVKRKVKFKSDYNSKYGVVSKGTELTGEIKPNGKVLLDFYEFTDSDKSANGEGFFTLSKDDALKYLTLVNLNSSATNSLNKILNKAKDKVSSVSESDKIESENPTKQDKNTFTYVGGALGFVSGVAYSFSKKTGFWKGVGITLIFNIAGAVLGKAIDYTLNQKNKNNEDGK